MVDGGNIFTISSAKDGGYLGTHTGSSSGAENYTVSFVPSQGYALQKESGNVQIGSVPSYFKAFSVTYSS